MREMVPSPTSSSKASDTVEQRTIDDIVKSQADVITQRQQAVDDSVKPPSDAITQRFDQTR